MLKMLLERNYISDVLWYYTSVILAFGKLRHRDAKSSRHTVGTYQTNREMKI